MVDRLIATVDGEPIYADEFDLIFRNCVRARILTDFASRSVDTNDASFWATDFDGRIPRVQAKEETLEEAVRVKLQFMRARDADIVADISYQTFLDRLSEENRRRAGVLCHDAVVYGPVGISEYGYYSYLLDQIVFALRARLGANVQEERLKTFYDENRETFRRQDAVNIDRIFVKLCDVGRPASLKAVEMAKQMLAQVEIELIKSAPATGIALKTPWEMRLQVEYCNIDVDPRLRGMEAKHGGSLSHQSDLLYEGQVSAAFETRSPVDWSESGVPSTLNIIRCVRRTKESSFAKLREAVRQRYVEAAYAHCMNEMVSGAVVDVSRDAYDEIELG